MKPRLAPQRAPGFSEEKLTFPAVPAELNRLLEARESVNIVDVRLAKDFEAGHIPGAVNLPKEKWGTLQGLAKDKLNVVLCYSQVCHLAAEAALFFSGKGYSVMELEGGFDAWTRY